MTFVFKVLRNGLLRYIHVQTCDDVQVHSATEWTASVSISHMPKPADVRVQIAMEMVCFRTYYAHVQTCDDVRVQSATEWMLCFGTYIYTHVHTYGEFRFHSAT